MTLMIIRVALALAAVLATAAVAGAQINTTPQPGLPNLGPFSSPSGTSSPTISPQPFGTVSPINPATGLPSNEPAVNPQTGLPSASPSTTTPAPFTLPPPVWSTPSPPAGVPLSPGSR